MKLDSHHLNVRDLRTQKEMYEWKLGPTGEVLSPANRPYTGPKGWDTHELQGMSLTYGIF